MLLRGVWNTVFAVSVYHLKCRDTWGCGGRHAATYGTPQLLESQWPALVPLDWGRATAGNLDSAEMTNVIAFTQPPSTESWKCSHCKNISVQVMSLLHAEVLWESLSRVCSPRLNIDSFRRLKSWKVSQQTFFYSPALQFKIILCTRLLGDLHVQVLLAFYNSFWFLVGVSEELNS